MEQDPYDTPRTANEPPRKSSAILQALGTIVLGVVVLILMMIVVYFGLHIFVAVRYFNR